MDAEKEQDPVASMAKFCKTSDSQEAKFPNCPLGQESQNYVGWNNGQSSSSPETMSEPTAILVISPPGSLSSVDKLTAEEGADADAVFLTPPEHHNSSQDQNPNELRAEGMDGGGSDEARVLEDTVPLGETEVVEMEEDEEGEGVDTTEVIDSGGGGDSGGEEMAMATSNLAQGSIDADAAATADVVLEIAGSMNGGATKIDTIEGNSENVEIGVTNGEKPVENSDSIGEIEGVIDGESCLNGKRVEEIAMDDSEDVEDIGVTRGEKRNENSDSIGEIEGVIDGKSSVSGKRIEEIEINDFENVEDIGVTRGEKPNENSDSTENLGSVKIEGDSDSTGNLGSVKIEGDVVDGKSCVSGKRIEEIDKFRYTGDADYGGCEGRKRQLPPSMAVEGKKEKVMKKRGLLDLLGILKDALGDTTIDDEEEDVDIIETAKSRGMIFPTPRWWPSDNPVWGAHDEK